MFKDHIQTVVDAVEQVATTSSQGTLTPSDGLYMFIDLIKETKGIVYVVGNGGSAGIASHFAVDLMKALNVPAMTLGEPGMVTCLSNDLGYDEVFRRQLKTIMTQDDLLVAISSSGTSENIINAASQARACEASTVTLTGFARNNPLRGMGDLNFWIDSDKYGIVEMAHMCMLHTLVDLWPSIVPVKVGSSRVGY